MYSRVMLWQEDMYGLYPLVLWIRVARTVSNAGSAELRRVLVALR